MNINKKHLAIGSKSGEKGIALLFTLGMLTVLLVLALGFATTSITQRRSAATNVQGTVARLLAESTLERVMGSLQFYDNSSMPCSHSLTVDDNDWLYKLGTADTGTTDVNGVFTWNTDYSDISWEYITVNDGANNKIIGRIAYVITFTPE
jgi:Tfp pilus assembly protein PilX